MQFVSATAYNISTQELDRLIVKQPSIDRPVVAFNCPFVEGDSHGNAALDILKLALSTLGHSGRPLA